MNVKIKLLGNLRKHLPANAGFNDATLEVGEGATPAEVIEKLQLPDSGSYMVLVNDERVAPEALASQALAAGDEVTVCPPIRGGSG